MIEHILYGAAGFLLAALLAFLFVPVLMDRAAKSATRKLKANLPFSTDEMEADKDQLKAAHAVELRKVEISLARAKDRLTSQDIELRNFKGQLEGANKIGKASKLAMEEMRQKEEALNAKLRESDTKLASLEAHIRQLIREKNDLQQTLRQAVSKTASLDRMPQQATTPSIPLPDPKEQLTSPSGLPIADETFALRRPSPSMKTDEVDDDIVIATEENKQVVASQKTTAVDHGVLQEKLFDVAAAITKLTATMEGDNSIIHEILAKAQNEEENSLSHRIQKLMEATNNQPGEEEASSPPKTEAPSPKSAKAKMKPITRTVKVPVPKPAAVRKTRSRAKPKAEAGKKVEPQKPAAEPVAKAKPEKLTLPKAEGFVIPEKAKSDA